MTVERRIRHQLKADRAARDAMCDYFDGLTRRELQDLDDEYSRDNLCGENSAYAAAVRSAMMRRRIPKKRTTQW